MSLRPLQNNVIIRIDPPREHIGSIIIPDRAQTEVGTGTIVAVGAGWVDPKNGRRHELDVQVGDRVAYEVFRATEKIDHFVDEGDDAIHYTVVQERHVLGVLEGDGEIEVNA